MSETTIEMRTLVSVAFWSRLNDNYGVPKANIERHPTRNAIIAGVIATVVGGLILAGILSTTFRQWIYSFITTTWKLITASWHYLLSSVPVPRWLLGLLILLSLVTLLRAMLLLFKSEGVDEPTWQSYTQDEFFGIVWRWDNEFLPSSIRPYCPRCDTLLVYFGYSGSNFTSSTLFSCETCRSEIANLEGNYDYIVAKVGRQIDRKMRNGEWKDVVVRTSRALEN
jgi:hypothetical protein